MMESGVTALPTAIGKVLWFLASDMRSFKIGMPVRDVGASKCSARTTSSCGAPSGASVYRPRQPLMRLNKYS